MSHLPGSSVGGGGCGGNGGSVCGGGGGSGGSGGSVVVGGGGGTILDHQVDTEISVIIHIHDHVSMRCYVEHVCVRRYVGYMIMLCNYVDI